MKNASLHEENGWARPIDVPLQSGYTMPRHDLISKSESKSRIDDYVPG